MLATLKKLTLTMTATRKYILPNVFFRPYYLQYADNMTSGNIYFENVRKFILKEIIRTFKILFRFIWGFNLKSTKKKY